MAEADRPAFLGAAAQRVASAYASSTRLETRCVTARGIDAVLQDLQVAAGWLDSGMCQYADVSVLARVLNSRQHNLALGASFPQQVHLEQKKRGSEGACRELLPIPARDLLSV